jgi:homotetrameric cytidine deaminase
VADRVTPPRRNVELKARDADPAATLARALALGASDEGVLTQRDTYFARARGRLKLREQEGGSEAGARLIAYVRADDDAARTSAYRLAEVGDPAALLEALDAALGTLVVVDKRRRLLLYENVRIHIDEVAGLGSFVELEGVAAADSDLSAERELVARLREELALGEPVAGSYSDLLLDAPQALLAAADAVMRNAYAPYSTFPVGAALRTRSGAIHVGANVENAAYPQGQCAEASAIGAMVAAGESEISAVAVVAEKLDVCPPCGGCRQRLKEFAGPDTPVYLGRPGGPLRTTSMAELLPLAFDEESLAEGGLDGRHRPPRRRPDGGKG